LAENESTQEKLKQGIAAAQRGDKMTARRLLQQVLTEDRNSELGWMWMAMVVESLDERRACLERALQINPNNARAREAMRRLGGELPPTAEAAPAGGDALQERLGDAVTAAGTMLRRSGNRNLYFALAAILGIVLLAIVLASLVPPSSQPASVQEAAETVTALAVAQLPQLLPTAVPVTPLPTRFTGIVVTLAPGDVLLPATFTPTPTPLPSATPLPTATPFPLAGFSLLYTAAAEGAGAGLFAVNADGSSGQAVTPDFGESVVFSPDGRQIAFVRGIPGTPTGQEAEANPTDAASLVPQLFVAPASDPGNARQLTQATGPTLSRPAWTADGSSLIYASDADGDGDLFILSLETTTAQPLTQNDADESDPVVSPDGRTIVFASDQDTPGSKELYSLPITGGTPVRLTNAGGSSVSPAFSPDGQRIAFVSDRTGDSDIYISDANGQRPFLVTIDDGDAEDRSPAFTPDGRWIAFASNRGGSGFQIYLISLDGSTLLPVTAAAGESVQSISMMPMTLP
jgi:hypothetical protein